MPSDQPASGHWDDIEARGHKVFVTCQGDAITLEAVNDDTPTVRMTFALSAAEAEEIAKMLQDMALVARG